MLNSPRRAETNCYYLPSLCKFYEGQVQSHMLFPSISHSSDTLQPFGCCTCTTQHPVCSPRARCCPSSRCHNLRYRPQRWSCLPQLHLCQQKTASPCPQHQQRGRGILRWKDPAPSATRSQVLSAEAPELPWREPELEPCLL